LKQIYLWAVGFGLTILAIFGAILYVDRALAKFAYLAFGHFTVVGSFSESPSLFSPLMILIATIFVLRRVARHPVSYSDVVLILCEISLITTKLALAPLKLIFGRTWPLYIHPSFLADGAYGFNFLTPGPQYESFPSGHTASLCAVAAVLWMTYPRNRSLYLVAVGGMASALVVGNYHFLSDVAAGGLLGALVAILTVVVSKGVWKVFPLISTKLTVTADNRHPS